MNMKKIFSAVIAVCMLFGVAGISAFAAEEGDVAEVKNLTGEGTQESPYLIGNLEELKWFRDDVNAGNSYSKKYVKLTANIDLNNEEWTPIGNSSNKFKGIFDGGEKTISNLSITGNNSDVGFFGFTTDGEIKNLTLNNAKVSGRLDVGALAGTPYTSKYTNINLTGHVEINGFSYVGGLGGKNAYADWTDVTINVDNTSYVNANSVEGEVAYRTYVGGVIGFMGEGGHKLTNITSNIDVTGSTIDVGGIVGIAHYGNVLKNISCSGDVTLTNAESLSDAREVGGIAGVWHNQNGQSVTFENCVFTGNISSIYTNKDGEKVTLTENDFANGGIIGAAYSDSGSGEMKIEYEAYIGRKFYKNFEEALADAATGDVVVGLFKDVSTDTIKLSSKLNLNGKTLTFTGKNNKISADVSNGNMVFTCSEEATYAAYINGNIAMNGVTVKMENVNAYADIMFSNGSVLNLSNSSIDIKKSNTNGGTAILSDSIGGILNAENSTITLTKVNRGMANMIVDFNDSTLSISGCTDNSMRNVSGKVVDTEITVDGGEYGLKNTNGKALEISGTSNVSISGSQKGDIFTSKNSDVTVTGGASLTSAKAATATKMDDATLAQAISNVGFEVIAGTTQRADTFKIRGTNLTKATVEYEYKYNGTVDKKVIPFSFSGIEGSADITIGTLLYNIPTDGTVSFDDPDIIVE